MPRVLLDDENPSEEQELEAMRMHWSRKFNHGKLVGERSAARLLEFLPRCELPDVDFSVGAVQRMFRSLPSSAAGPDMVSYRM
eukprot:3173447-Amphidinium_carterae.1